VLEYFEAVKVGLTATPALHTTQIFGPAVFHYGYRQAVIDGYITDHLPPRRILTALAEAGITFEGGEEVNVLDPRTGQIDLYQTEDTVSFEVKSFNRRVHTRAFNRVVAEAIAAEIPPKQPGKCLIFAARDDHADIVVDELLKALEAEHGPQPPDLVEKITGTVDRPSGLIRRFRNDARPKYVVTVDLLTTGIDIPAITDLVFLRRVNSRVLYEQMLGRATRRCEEIGKTHFRIFDAVDIYANLQAVTEMRPVVVDPRLTFATSSPISAARRPRKTGILSATRSWSSLLFRPGEPKRGAGIKPHCHIPAPKAPPLSEPRTRSPRGLRGRRRSAPALKPLPRRQPRQGCCPRRSSSSPAPDGPNRGVFQNHADLGQL
jgi:type I site-specific restriction endonuclease